MIKYTYTNNKGRYITLTDTELKELNPSTSEIITFEGQTWFLFGKVFYKKDNLTA